MLWLERPPTTYAKMPIEIEINIATVIFISTVICFEYLANTSNNKPAKITDIENHLGIALKYITKADTKATKALYCIILSNFFSI